MTLSNHIVIPCALQRVLRDALPLHPEGFAGHVGRSASKDESAGLLRMKTLLRSIRDDVVLRGT